MILQEIDTFHPINDNIYMHTLKNCLTLRNKTLLSQPFYVVKIRIVLLQCFILTYSEIFELFKCFVNISLVVDICDRNETQHIFFFRKFSIL